MAIEIKLPKEQQPEFPAECIGCGAAAPGRLVTLRDWGWVRSRRTVVPACGPCGWRIRLWRFAKTIGLGIVYGLATWAVFRWLEGRFRVVRMLAAIGVGVMASLPIHLWEMIRPPPVLVEVGTELITYRFRDPTYAAMFHAMNGGTAAGSP